MRPFYYLMEENIFREFIKFQNDLDKLRLEINHRDEADLRALAQQSIEDQGVAYEIIGSTAYIPIAGELVQTVNVCAALFGFVQTTYQSIIDNTLHAENNNDVEKIVYMIDSPGGYVSGVDETAMVIRNAKKPTESQISNLGASAAYWLASQTDKIIATSPVAEIGSIGVIATVVDRSKEDEQYGIKRYVITSKDAPEKAFDFAKEKDRKRYQERLNEIHNVFARRVAEGRKTTEKDVNENFGKGGVLIAEKALKAGMIDGIMNNEKITTNDNVNQSAIAPEQGELHIENKPAHAEGREVISNMTTNQLLAENPELYNQIYQAGIEAERKRAYAIASSMSKANKYTDLYLNAMKMGQSLEETFLAVQAADIAAKEQELSVKNSPEDIQAQDQKLEKSESSEDDKIEAEIEKNKNLIAAKYGGK